MKKQKYHQLLLAGAIAIATLTPHAYAASMATEDQDAVQLLRIKTGVTVAAGDKYKAAFTVLENKGKISPHTLSIANAFYNARRPGANSVQEFDALDAAITTDTILSEFENGTERVQRFVQDSIQSYTNFLPNLTRPRVTNTAGFTLNEIFPGLQQELASSSLAQDPQMRSVTTEALASLQHQRRQQATAYLTAVTNTITRFMDGLRD